jgi:hypothetical protein
MFIAVPPDRLSVMPVGPAQLTGHPLAQDEVWADNATSTDPEKE